jgi:hypothetical protein
LLSPLREIATQAEGACRSGIVPRNRSVEMRLQRVSDRSDRPNRVCRVPSTDTVIKPEEPGSVYWTKVSADIFVWVEQPEKWLK